MRLLLSRRCHIGRLFPFLCSQSHAPRFSPPPPPPPSPPFQSMLRGDLEVSNKDAFMLASLWLQATRGDYSEERDTVPVCFRL